MKPASLLILALLAIAPVTFAQSDSLSRIGGYMSGRSQQVSIGDLLYLGTTYVNASATITRTGDISVTSSWTGTRTAPKTVVIPWDKAPWDLRSKMQGQRTAFEAARKPEDSRLGATEAALTARYGKPEPHPTPLAPAQKSLLYSPEGLRIVAHFVDDRADCLVVMKREGEFSKEEAIKILAQCGRWHPQGGDVWRREDGGFAIVTGGVLRMESGTFYKARTATKSAADSF